jgi:hypothetical protein
MYVGETEEGKYTLSLSLKLIKAGRYDFSYLCDGSRTSKPFFKRFLADAAFDMVDLDYPVTIIQIICH